MGSCFFRKDFMFRKEDLDLDLDLDPEGVERASRVPGVILTPNRTGPGVGRDSRVPSPSRVQGVGQDQQPTSLVPEGPVNKGAQGLPGLSVMSLPMKRAHLN